MSNRRSERLRRKRQSQPGAYSPYDDGYVVESEASFLPPPAPPPDSRHARYKDSPHRLTDQSPDLARRRRANDAMVDRVATSLFDILGSATRRPVNPTFRRAPMRTDDPDVIQSDDDEDDDNVNTGVRRPTQQSTRIPPQRSVPSVGHPRSRNPGASRRAPAPSSIARRVIPTRKLAPVAVMLALLCLAPVVLLMLDGLLSSRRATHARVGSAWRLRVSIPTLPCQSGECRLRVRTMLSALRAFLLRAASRPSVGRPNDDNLSSMDTTTKKDESATMILPPDVVTREQLNGEFAPRVLAAARKAAEAEAARLIAAMPSATTGDGDASAEGQNREEDEMQRRETFEQFVERFAADKDLPADFALASAGGTVIASQPSAVQQLARFAKRYATALVSDGLFTPSWPTGASAVVKPEVLPGNCWTFGGSKGSVTIRLARPVRVSAVSVEHTPQRSVFSIDSAMKRFRVVALRLGEDGESSPADVQVGEFEFEVGEGKHHLQTFEVTRGVGISRAVRFEILSNHGGRHTAVYRLRVHGEEVNIGGRDDLVGGDEA